MTTSTSTSTDLATVEKVALDRLNKSLAKTSLEDFLNSARRSLLLVDCSGSMSDWIKTGGTKIEALRTVVADLRETHPVPVAAFYASHVSVVESIPEPQGGTPLAQAIRFGGEQEANHLVVVTDGIPNSETDAFDAARAFGGPVDTFYIGNGSDRGATFCAELAAMTGGVSHLTDLGKPKELAGSIRLMLGDGN